MDKIKNISFLDESDKKILTEGFLNNMDIKILQTMSVCSNLGSFKKIDEYEYFETHENEDIYYLKNCYEIFVDKNKKILLPSRYFFSITIDLFITFLNNSINILNNIDFNNNLNIYDIGSNIISIEKWFETYGHFKDEMFINSDFQNKIQKISKEKNTILCYYKYFVNNINYSKNNYDILNNYLFDNDYINVFKFNEPIIKMKKLKLIIHNMNNNNFKTFHSFPKQVRDIVYLKCNEELTLKNINPIIHKNIFITRGNALHLPRNLSNQKEIEEYLLSMDYYILNPEEMSLPLFINTIKYADNIFITWGGALVNLIYLKPHTNVYILKSKSYNENLVLFQKIIDTYELNVKVIECDDNNIIDTELIKKVL